MSPISHPPELGHFHPEWSGYGSQIARGASLRVSLPKYNYPEGAVLFQTSRVRSEPSKIYTTDMAEAPRCVQSAHCCLIAETHRGEGRGTWVAKIIQFGFFAKYHFRAARRRGRAGCKWSPNRPVFRKCAPSAKST